jgi:hypothetical protein
MEFLLIETNKMIASYLSIQGQAEVSIPLEIPSFKNGQPFTNTDGAIAALASLISLSRALISSPTHVLKVETSSGGNAVFAQTDLTLLDCSKARYIDRIPSLVTMPILYQ